MKHEEILKELRNVFGTSDEIYLVGGAVRDFLEGKSTTDIDVVAKVPPEKLINMGAVPVDPVSAYPVFYLKNSVLGKIEVALPRTEKKNGTGHKGFSMVANHTLPIEDDLRRRDFTVNSIAMTLSSNLIDPFGGVKDLKQRILRHTSEAFVEDPLRVFRAYRFSAKGFSISEETKTLIRTMEEELKTLPPERVFAEMMKAMTYENPRRFFEEMVNTGVGRHHFNVVFMMADIPAGPVEYHPEGTVLTHSLEVLDRIAMAVDDPETRLVAFLHDVGKVLTPKDQLPAHHGHEDVGEELVGVFLESLRAPNNLIQKAKGVVREHMRAPKMNNEMTPSKILKVAQAALAGNYVNDLVELVWADGRISIGTPLYLAVGVMKLNVKELGLDEDDLKERSGRVVKNMVWERRVAALKKKLKEMRGI